MEVWSKFVSTLRLNISYTYLSLEICEYSAPSLKHCILFSTDQKSEALIFACRHLYAGTCILHDVLTSPHRLLLTKAVVLIIPSLFCWYVKYLTERLTTSYTSQLFILLSKRILSLKYFYCIKHNELICLNSSLPTSSYWSPPWGSTRANFSLQGNKTHWLLKHITCFTQLHCKWKEGVLDTILNLLSKRNIC